MWDPPAPVSKAIRPGSKGALGGEGGGVHGPGGGDRAPGVPSHAKPSYDRRLPLTRRSSVPSGRIVKAAVTLPIRRARATCSESGAQANASIPAQRRSVHTGRNEAPVPLLRTYRMDGTPSRWVSYAIVRPSGDHPGTLSAFGHSPTGGSVAWQPKPVSFRTLPPSAVAT